MKFLITITQDEDGIFIAECPAIPGCVSQGETAEGAERNIQDAVQECLAVRGSLLAAAPGTAALNDGGDSMRRRVTNCPSAFLPSANESEDKSLVPRRAFGISTPAVCERKRNLGS